MKYLNSFNEAKQLKAGFSQEDIEDIKDMFQEIVDEYNLEEVSDIDMEDEEFKYSIQISYNYITAPISFDATIIDEVIISIIVDNYSTVYDETSFDKDLKDFRSRLKLAGYLPILSKKDENVIIYIISIGKL